MSDRPPASSTDEEYKTNVELSYEYVEKSIGEIQDISNHTNTQLGLLIGFNFTYIRFFLSELPASSKHIDSLPCNSCSILKILAYIFSIASIIAAFIGLYRSIQYTIITPKQLIENCKNVANVEFKLAIINTFQKKLEEFIKLAEQKKYFFNSSVGLLCLSGLMAILDRIIASIFD